MMMMIYIRIILAQMWHDHDIHIMPYNSWADVVRLQFERHDTKSNVKLGGFRSQLQASYVSSHTEELWYNETVSLWMTMYIYIYIYIYIYMFILYRQITCVIHVQCFEFSYGCPQCWWTNIYICIDMGCPRGVMVKAMDCGIVERKFALQSRYNIHFRANTLGKGMNPLILPAMG